MFIATNYQNEVRNTPEFSDHEFMARQIWQMQHVFHNELASIKNTKHEFVAFTNAFAKEFNVDDSLLGLTALDMETMNEIDCEEIHKQEQQIFATHGFQDSFFLLKRNKDVINYVLRKHCLVNPSTGNCVGVFSNTSRVVPGVLRRLIIKNFLPFGKPTALIERSELSEQQRQIAFCILLGFHSRKEIARILSNMTNSDYSENRIKNSLQALYNKFDCNTPGQLLNLISSGQIDVELPADIISSGNYPINQATMSVKDPKK